MSGDTQELFNQSPKHVKEIIVKVLGLEQQNIDKQKPQILDAITTIVKDQIQEVSDEKIEEGQKE